MSDVNSAVRCHENSVARASPRFLKSSRKVASSATRDRLSAIARTLRGSTSTAAPSDISFIEELFDVITGAPHAIASTIGNPNPSSNDGYTKAVAPLNHDGKSGRGT